MWFCLDGYLIFDVEFFHVDAEEASFDEEASFLGAVDDIEDHVLEPSSQRDTGVTMGWLNLSKWIR